MSNEYEDKTQEELIELKKQINLQLSILEIRRVRLVKAIEMLKKEEGDDDEWWKKSEQKN